jgi:hypothetical protein
MPLLVLARNETAESSLEFTCRRGDPWESTPLGKVCMVLLDVCHSLLFKLLGTPTTAKKETLK